MNLFIGRLEIKQFDMKKLFYWIPIFLLLFPVCSIYAQ